MSDRANGEVLSIVTAEERVSVLVREILGRSSRRIEFAYGDTLAEVGLTSMDMVSLMLQVEGAFDLAIPQDEITPEAFRSVSTIAALVKRLNPRDMSAGW
jgi:acyl carrier protein